ncbi:hypothetical protein I308_105424 [Cryptococcus tetragattii IND107]|uniref:Uncharacterized protein n=1 Tax=Cryptococcus tetragattii IND107 TaxID=1296105 RepID=A0ABR3BKY5_9TREE
MLYFHRCLLPCRSRSPAVVRSAMYWFVVLSLRRIVEPDPDKVHGTSLSTIKSFFAFRIFLGLAASAACWTAGVLYSGSPDHSPLLWHYQP